MQQNNKGNESFRSKLHDVVRGHIELRPSLDSSVIHGCSIEHMELDEKYLLFFSIVDQSSNAIVITDVDKQIVYVNKEFEQVSGYSSNEVLGKNPNILKSNKTPVDTYVDMRNTLSSKKQWRGEFTNRHKDGGEYIEEAVISPIINAKGDLVCYLAEKKDITQQKKAERAIYQLTHFDSLTNVPNRNFFLEEADKLTNFSRECRNHFAVLFLDLDRFKELNDTYGHLYGDKALQMAAKRIESVISSEDFLARVGGDEFVVVHKHATELSTRKLAVSLVDTFNLPVTIENEENYLGISIGSAQWPEDGDSIREILSRADLAMYKAKSSDRSYCCYNKTLGEKFDRELDIARKLSVAVQEKNLSLVYQPKIDLKTREFCGLEALLRWHDDELGMISPAEFIPIAEKHKLMTSIGNWVISEACEQINRWKAVFPSFDRCIAINISVQQIESIDFYSQIMSRLNEQKISPNQIELEITESVLISDPDRIMALSAQLRKAGFNISIDDFGTGYSSMSYLSQLQANILKIDSSFVRNITNSKYDRTIVKSMIELGHNLGLTIIAEGVENNAQLSILQYLGCDIAQGYLFCKPLPASDLLSLILSDSEKMKLLG